MLKGELTLLSQETQLTHGAAGGASTLPNNPTGYLKVIIENTEYIIPYYAQA